VHVPALPDTSHASQFPVHGVLQQTPSTQFAFGAAHSFDAEQLVPALFFGTHAPPAQ
jgi:hypothetical protein